MEGCAPLQRGLPGRLRHAGGSRLGGWQRLRHACDKPVCAEPSAAGKGGALQAGGWVWRALPGCLAAGVFSVPCGGGVRCGMRCQGALRRGGCLAASAFSVQRLSESASGIQRVRYTASVKSSLIASNLSASENHPPAGRQGAVTGTGEGETAALAAAVRRRRKQGG